MQIARLLFTLCIVLIMGHAHADTVPAKKFYEMQGGGSNTHKTSTPETTCQSYLANSSAWTYSSTVQDKQYPQQPTFKCMGTSKTVPNSAPAHIHTAQELYTCDGIGGILRFKDGLPSPALYPMVCIDVPACPEGQTRQPDGTCGVPPPPECEKGCNGACGQQKTFNRLRTLACINLCIYRLGGGMEIELSNGESRAYMTVQNNTGASCTPEQETTTPDPTPCPECECQNKGQSYVVMAGVATCVAPGTPGSEPIKKQDPPKVETHTPAPSPENPNPEPEVTETPSPIITITPAPAGSPPGTGPTITETTANADGSSTSTAQGQDKFCQANPNHALCKADDAKKFCEENPDVLACQKLDEPGEGEAIGEKTIDLGFSPVDVPGATGGSCPAPVTISIGGRSASLSWDWLCQYAAGVKPAVLAVAWLSAALIVFGAVRERD